MTGAEMRNLRRKHGLTFKDLRLDECPDTARIDKALYSKIENGYADPTPALQKRVLSLVGLAIGETVAHQSKASETPVATLNMDIPRQARRASYEAMDKETRKKQILECLEVRDMTAIEIAKELGFHERNATAPRLTELRKAGRVEPCGIRIDGTTGRPVTVWRIIENGK